MRKSNSILFIIAGILLVSNVVLFLMRGSGKSLSFDAELYKIENVADINLIRISGKKDTIVLENGPNKWLLNDEYDVDEGLRRLLLSILQNVKVMKPVSLKPTDSIEVLIQGAHELHFNVFGNLTKTKTYFHELSSGQSYEVAIPGYSDYLGGIFELSSNQWRDRVIMDENWRTIKSFLLQYKVDEIEDVFLEFDDTFFNVKGVSRMDSSFVVDYLNQFKLFEVNEIISAQTFPKYDSLSRTTPLAEIKISTINQRDPITLKAFPSIENQPFHLIVDDSGELMIMDDQRLAQILVKQVDFQAKD
jgi:hypothetical protein